MAESRNRLRDISAAVVSIVFDGNRRVRRQGEIFDGCAGLFDACAISLAPDGFARLDGRVGSRRYRLGLIPDSLTIKRLPQLWLSLEMPCRAGDVRIAVTARPRSEDFFSAAAPLRHRVEIPPWLPHDLAIRCATDCGEAWIERYRGPLCAAFADMSVKEISIEPNGLRLIYRLAEGDRGRHLLLRQSSFDAALSPDLLMRLTHLLQAFELTPASFTERAA